MEGAGGDEMETCESPPPPGGKPQAARSPISAPTGGLAALRAREVGGGPRRWTAGGFCASYRGSKALVQRLELSCVHNWHDGCVNTVHFTESGRKLISGSDDLSICIGDWQQQRDDDEIPKSIFSYPSGHVNNVFQAKTMPHSNEGTIVTCAADGQVRVAVVSGGGVTDSRLLANHRGRAHKLAIIPSDANMFLSTGEDGVVHQLDLRDSNPAKAILRLIRPNRCGPSVLGLNCISLNPVNENEFCVGGDDKYVRVYDRRRISDTRSTDPVCKFYPSHMTDTKHITCTAYSCYGNEILATYSEEDIYLFKNTGSATPGEYVRRYSGHINARTVKGVNFFGSRSEFVVSGSDCGHLFFWDKASGDVLQMLKGDEDVVNCLEPHPHMAVMATSGIDSNIKIWTPTALAAPDKEKLERQLANNKRQSSEPGLAARSLHFSLPAWMSRDGHLPQFMLAGESDDDDDNDDDEEEHEVEVVSGASGSEDDEEGSDDDDDDDDDDEDDDEDDDSSGEDVVMRMPLRKRRKSALSEESEKASSVKNGAQGGAAGEEHASDDDGAGEDGEGGEGGGGGPAGGAVEETGKRKLRGKEKEGV